MTDPKVSIIVPVYKTEKYLMRCIDSLRQQTLTDIEIILVDDESPDTCPILCDKAALEDSRIKVIHKRNEGAGLARNAGIAIARGEYIGFVDSDDYADCRMYEELYSTAKKYDAQLVMSGVCFVGGNVFGKDGEYLEKEYFSTATLFESEDEIKNLKLGIIGALPHEPDDSRYGTGVWKNLYKREVIQNNRISFLSEREICSEDALFTVDYIHCINKAVGIPGAFYRYCRNENSISKSYNRERFETCFVFIKELENRFSREFSAATYRIYLDRLTQSFGRVFCSQEIMYARENNVRFSVLRKKLNEICTRKEISDALKCYPWYRLPFKQAVFAFTMKYRLFLLQILIVILRDI